MIDVRAPRFVRPPRRDRHPPDFDCVTAAGRARLAGIVGAAGCCPDPAPDKDGWRRLYGECTSGPALRRSDRPLSVGQDDAPRSAAVRRRLNRPARQRARRQFGRRPCPRGARPADVDRTQRRQRTSFLGDPWTILDCPGSVELLYEAQGALLASDVAVVVVEPEVERALTISSLLTLSRPAPDPAHGFHQQDGQRQCAGARRAGGVAIGVEPAAGAAPGAVARRRIRNHRLCRPGQRARLSLSAGPGFGSDPVAGRVLGRRSARPAPASWKSSPISTTPCSNSCSKRSSRPKEEIYRHLTQTLKGAQVVPVFLGSGARRLRGPPAVEGAAPRDAAAAGDRRPARHRRRGRAVGAGDQDLSPAAYRQALAGAGLARARSPRAWC